MAYRTAGLVLVGGIVAWCKSVAGVPALPAGYVECNGQTLSDTQSPLNGQVIPALNSTNTSITRFLRGSATSPTASGATGGSTCHTHARGATCCWAPVPRPNDQSVWEYLHDMTTVSHLPRFVEVVWCMRVK